MWAWVWMWLVIGTSLLVVEAKLSFVLCLFAGPSSWVGIVVCVSGGLGVWRCDEGVCLAAGIWLLVVVVGCPW